MGVTRQEIGIDGWPGGVSPATDATFSDILTSPRGYNTAIASATTGKPFLQKRMGLGVLTETPVTGSPAITGLFEYVRVNAADRYRLISSNTGRLDYTDTDGTLHTIGASTFTAGDLYPHFAVANDLCFMVNGTDAKKLRGTTVENFGITRPTVGSLAATGGASGSPNGTYDLRCHFYNSNTGHESSASDTAAATVTVVGKKLNVTGIPVPTDAQVTDVYIDVRNTATMSQFYVAGSVAAGVTTATLDFVDANLVTVAPGLTAYDPPPAGVKHLAYHHGRMFAATESGLYWSDVNKPEAFNALSYDPVNADDGQMIMSIVSAHEVLLILKEDKLYVLYGDDPASWTIRLVDSDYGCVAMRTVITRNGWTWWWSRHGVVRWDGSGKVDPIGRRLYGDPNETVNLAAIETACACADDSNMRLLFAVPETDQTTATMILPVNTILNVFESNKWDPMTVSALGNFTDSGAVLRPFLGNRSGQVFQMWSTNNDGIPEGSSHTGTFVAGTASVSTITDGTATFHNTGGKLIARKVTVLDADGIFKTGEIRPSITTNDATSVTLDNPITGLVVGATYTYIIGGPDFQVDTPWLAGGNDYFTKERYDWLFLMIRGSVQGVSSRFDVSFNQYDIAVDPASFATSGVRTTSVWDDEMSMWDTSVWDIPTTATFKFSVHRVGRSWRGRIRNSGVNQPLAILRIAMQSVRQTIKE